MLNLFPEKRQPNARFELATVRFRSALSTTELIRLTNEKKQNRENQISQTKYNIEDVTFLILKPFENWRGTNSNNQSAIV